jgi:two-component system OmpR family sensor kinase
LVLETSTLESQNTPPNLGPHGKPGSETFSQSDLRMIARSLPSGENILVGCSIAPELHELEMTALKLAGVGIIVLFFGLAGGWWISLRAIKPVESISATAVKIAAGDLSQRIDAADTESELGQLAAVLNSTFARLEAAFAQQKQFASDAAHELRTPVSVILTQAQTALNRNREAKDYKQTIEACQRAAQRMRRLIGSLLELARLDAGQEQMKRLCFDLSKMVADSVELIHPLAEECGIKLISELSPVEIAGDSERLWQVMTNLLTNAIEYNHDGGEVKVTLKLEGGMAVLTVSDTGQGIPAEDLPRVFERFYRADKSRSSGNAGLGLAICKSIVAAHGGNIEVESKENAGTTFTVRLPA